MFLYPLQVPRSLPARDGSNYVPIQAGAEIRLAGMIQWVDGEVLEDLIETQPDTVSERFRQLGNVMGRIRRHSESWRPPPGFDRRRWDRAGFVGESPLWGRFWEVPPPKSRQRRVLSEARAEFDDFLRGLSTATDRFGLIHADLHLSNLLSAPNSLVAIDFDDSGFGWYIYEMAVGLVPSLNQPWHHEARSALITGYRDIYPIQDDELSTLDRFIALRAALRVGWLSQRPELGHSHVLPNLVDEAVTQIEAVF